HSSNTTVATVSINAGRQLVIAAKQIGTSVIALRATDYDGAFVTQNFIVTVVASTGRLSNIATRLNVMSDPNELIAGFVLTGTAPKRVLIRAIGPSLAAAHIATPLA